MAEKKPDTPKPVATPPNASVTTPPVETKASPIWDEKNRLVDKEADAYYRKEAERVLGKDTEERLKMPEVDYNEIRKHQKSESGTADPLTLPTPDTNVHNRPYVPKASTPTPPLSGASDKTE